MGIKNKIKEYDKFSHFSEIARRYFAVNSFDGILTLLGILAGNFTSGVDNSEIIISTGVATSLAMAVSGFSASYFSEQAERKNELNELERNTLTKLGKTRIGKAHRTSNFIVAFTNGMAPFISGILIVLPFLFLPVDLAYKFSVMESLLLLIGLGAFLGKVSRGNVIGYSLKMFLAGVVCIAVLWLLRV